MQIALDANDVAAYLKNHPEFFNHYADLLAQLLIPDPHNGRAISITERQLAALRDRNKQLEAKRAELIQFGEENDAISAKVHALSCDLAAADSFSVLTQTVHAHLGDAFAVPHVALRLYHLPGDDAPGALADETTRRLADTLKHPYCGPADGINVSGADWLDPGMRSLALIPLGQGEAHIGLLILGSEEIQRFYPEMGTLFLERIGELVSAAAQRTLRTLHTLRTPHTLGPATQ